MTLHYLHRDAFFCLLEEGAVFLNARRCEYLALECDHVAALSSVVVGWPVVRSAKNATSSVDAPFDRVLTALVGRGVLTLSAAEGKAAEPISLASRRARPSTSHLGRAPSMPLADIAGFLLALLRTYACLRRRSLLSFLRRIETAKLRASANAPRVSVDTPTLMNRFERLRVWSYSAEGACLKDSLVLTEFLLRRGGQPTFVMGVRSKPFAAHAWVQEGDVVLNDTLENVQRYAPIVAI